MTNYCRTCEKQLSYGEVHPDHKVYVLDELRKLNLSTEQLLQELQQEFHQKGDSALSLYIRLMIDLNLDHYGILDFLKQSKIKKYQEVYQSRLHQINHIGLPSMLCIYYSLSFITDLVTDYLKSDIKNKR